MAPGWGESLRPARARSSLPPPFFCRGPDAARPTLGVLVSSSNPPGGPQGPEYLEQGGGAPLDPSRENRPGGRRGRRPALVVGAVLAVALVGGGAWAVSSFLATGSQPAEALPDSTLGYVSIDLDPGGGQKIEAIRTLRKFPAFREQIGLQTDDDVRRRIFEELQQESPCAGLDYADDVEPWLGHRAAVAALDTGADRPTAVAVVQVTDEGAARDGLDKIGACAQGDGGTGYAIDGGWAVIAETDEIARGVVDGAADAPLSDDADFQSWTGEVGDPGVVAMYAAPAAGAYLAENLDGLGSVLGPGAMAGATTGATSALEEFRGAAATVRFHDGALELEVAADSSATASGAYAEDRGDDVLATLPADTAAALGIGFSDGWFRQLAEQLSSYAGGAASTDDFLAMLSEASGLDLPADAETLAGESLAVAVGSGLDPDTLANSSDGSDVPVAIKVKGDAEEIESVLDKVRGRLGSGASALGSDSDGDVVAIGPNPAFRSTVLADGGLGVSDTFTAVVPRAAGASAILFVNFDAGGDWLAKLAGGDQQATENLEPLAGLGISAWQQGEAGHALLRLTTN